MRTPGPAGGVVAILLAFGSTAAAGATPVSPVPYNFAAAIAAELTNPGSAAVASMWRLSQPVTFFGVTGVT